MPHFTTSERLKFRSYLIAHGVDASTAERVATKIQQKSQRNTPLTAEETALIDGYMVKDASMTQLKSANVSQKVSPWPSKWQSPSLKTGYTDTSHKISKMSFKFFNPKPKGAVYDFAFKIMSLSNKAVPLSNKAQKVSVYSPGTVRQLAYKVASS